MLATLRRILALVGKEFRTILKDPKSRIVVFGPPILQFFLFGYAATFEVQNVRLAVLDEDRTTESRALVARFAASELFRVTHELSSDREIQPLIDRKAVRMVLHVGPNFGADLDAGLRAPVQVIVDGRNSNVAGIALGYASEIVARFNAERGGGAGPGTLVERAWYNPNFSSRWYIVSCLGGVISMVVVVLLSSLSVAREREFGTFDQLLVTPLTPLGILVGKAVPPLVFGMLDAGILSVAAVLWYGVPFTGSLLAAFLALFAFMLAVVGVGLFISSLSTTMQQGLLGSFVFIMPAVILSGFTTPIQSMPDWLQTASAVNPLRWVVKALREVFLEAATVADVVGDLVPLSVIAAVTLSASAWLFRRRTG